MGGKGSNAHFNNRPIPDYEKMKSKNCYPFIITKFMLNILT